MAMKTVEVSDLMAKLRDYLRDVRHREEVVVLDGTTPVARLTPIERGGDDVVISESTGPPPQLKKLRPVRLRKKVDLVEILRESRDVR
jgi:antitoxin (DNA-binding transcriptional repressor) of toxin-antitoxin stability system